MSSIIKEFGVGSQTVFEFLKKKGCPIAENDLNQKIDEKQYEMLKKEFGADKELRGKAEEMIQNRQSKRPAQQPKEAKTENMVETKVPESMRPHLVTKGKINLDEPQKPKAAAPKAQPTAPKTEKPAAPAKPATEAPKPAAAAAKPAEKKERPSVEERAAAIGEEQGGVFKLHTQTEISGPKVLGTIDLSSINSTTRPKKRSKDDRRRGGKNNGGNQNGNAQNNANGQGNGNGNGQRKKRARIGNERVDVNSAANQPSQNNGGNNNRRNNNNNNNGSNNNQGGSKRSKERNRRAKEVKTEVTEEDVAKQVKETLARLTNKQKGSKGAKYRKEKREQQHARAEEERREAKAESKVLKLTEFVTANELAQMMDV